MERPVQEREHPVRYYYNLELDFDYPDPSYGRQHQRHAVSLQE